MMRCVEVLCRMGLGRIIAAADLAALEAEAQVYPARPHGQAVLAALGRAGLHVMDMAQVRAFVAHFGSLPLEVELSNAQALTFSVTWATRLIPASTA